MRFSKYNFDREIHDNIEKLGYKKPTDIQFKSIPPILRGEDVLGIANTGTGKTVAFALPVIQSLLNRSRNKSKNVRCIVMVPTHELAIQVEEVFHSLSANTPIVAVGIYGGADQTPQIALLKKGADIVIATPGRLFDLSSQGHISLDTIDILILDEADHMLELGFKKDMVQLISNIPHKPQTLFFSATINEYVKNMAYDLVKKGVRIHISPQDPVSKNITHSVAHIQMDDKRFFLERIINDNPGKKILVFVRTKVRAERVLKALERVNLFGQTIHSDKNQDERTAVMSAFKSGENNILIATDVSARGIDIPNVEIVVNYDLPEEAENYVHRVGRTGRGTQKGLAVSFCSEQETEVLTKIEAFLESKINVIDIKKSEYKETIDLSSENHNDWRSLIEEELIPKKKKKKK